MSSHLEAKYNNRSSDENFSVPKETHCIETVCLLIRFGLLRVSMTIGVVAFHLRYHGLYSQLRGRLSENLRVLLYYLQALEGDHSLYFSHLLHSSFIVIFSSNIKHNMKLRKWSLNQQRRKL